MNETMPLAAEIDRACQQFRWNFKNLAYQGSTGSLAGRNLGSSVEFKDFRDYTPGDEVRHIDWAAYGRNDRLTVRLYREEVSPWLDIVVDQSRSMAIEDGRKADLTRALAGFMLRQGLAHTRLYGASQQLHRLEAQQTLTFEADESVLLLQPAACVPHLRRGSLRCLLSDFLSPHEPRHSIMTLAAHASQLIVIQVLGPWEADPVAGEALTLVDAETRKTLALTVTPAVRQRYLNRLQQLQQNLRQACIQCGAVFVPVVANAELDLSGCLRRDFAPLNWVDIR